MVLEYLPVHLPLSKITQFVTENIPAPWILWGWENHLSWGWLSDSIFTNVVAPQPVMER